MMIDGLRCFYGGGWVNLDHEQNEAGAP